MPTLHERIDEARGEWWHADNGDTFRKLADELVGYGLTEDQAVGILTGAMAAMADEYGE